MGRDAWDTRYAAPPGLVWTGEPNRFVVRELAKLSPGRALDLAAGEGRNAVWLAERGWRVTAMDLSAVAVGRGRRLAQQTPRWFVFRTLAAHVNTAPNYPPLVGDTLADHHAAEVRAQYWSVAQPA